MIQMYMATPISTGENTTCWVLNFAAQPHIAFRRVDEMKIHRIQNFNQRGESKKKYLSPQELNFLLFKHIHNPRIP